MKHLNFLSQLKLRYKNFSPFWFCTVTFLGPAQRSKPGSVFSKAGPVSEPEIRAIRWVLER
jgi:hypothetical protein